MEQKAVDYVEAENERYKKANCVGMSAEACSVKMYTERREALEDVASTGADFVPVVGTIKKCSGSTVSTGLSLRGRFPDTGRACCRGYAGKRQRKRYQW
ncbi:hypothetical protein WDV93_23605 [Pantoea ananatis]